MEKQIIDIPGMKRALGPDGQPIAPLSSAIRAGDFIFVSGQPPMDLSTGTLIEGDIKAQTRQSLENMKRILEAAGSSLDKVVKTTIFCANAAYFGQVNDIYREYFPKDQPTRTFVNVGSWPMAFDIEIECTAIA